MKKILIVLGLTAFIIMPGFVTASTRQTKISAPHLKLVFFQGTVTTAGAPNYTIQITKIMGAPKGTSLVVGNTVAVQALTRNSDKSKTKPTRNKRLIQAGQSVMVIGFLNPDGSITKANLIPAFILNKSKIKK
jgi:hypothetical protein